MRETIYLLTGGAGFLGSNVSRLLALRNENVRVLALPGDSAAKTIPAGVEVVSGDLLDPNALERFFSVPEGVDRIVLHLASVVTVAPEWDEKVHAVNVTGTERILAFCLRYKVKKLVYVSSTGAIPERPHGEAIREPERFDPDAVLGCYQKTKAEATQRILDAVAWLHTEKKIQLRKA